MLILGIETSCDETAAAVVKDGTVILSNVVASSAEMHVKTGGIIPERAAREQIKAIIPVIEKALKESGENEEVIDALAVTVGPGLIGSLLVGVETAKTLSYLWNKPLVPVNHLTAHIYANWLANENMRMDANIRKNSHGNSQSISMPKLPAIALVVSGGHTDLVLMKDHGELKWLGGTRDDAAGEAFDKTARLLGLGYPGGPAISAAAEKFEAQSTKSEIKLPRPMLGENNFDFSFSGLKTAVVREVEHLKAMKPHTSLTSSRGLRPRVGGARLRGRQLSNEAIELLAYEIQEAITDVLVAKTMRAVKKYKVPTLLLAGGVAANQRLREKFNETMKQFNHVTIDLRVPPVELCTDNATYIAAYAEYNYKPVPWQKVNANPNLRILE